MVAEANGVCVSETNGSLVGSARRSHSSSEDLLWKYAPLKHLLFLDFLVALGVGYFFAAPLVLYPLLAVLVFIPAFLLFCGVHNYLYVRRQTRGKKSKIDDFVEFRDETLKRAYSGKFIPVREFYEAFADGRISLKVDTLEALEQRSNFMIYKFNFWHLKFCLLHFLPDLLCHFRSQDKSQVTEHYDRGNDFYNFFLGPTMVYTSGLIESRNDSLEEMQHRKMKAVCELVNMKEGDRHLDLGCGWGTFVNFAAKNYGSIGTGITLAKEQVEWAREKSLENKVEHKTKFLCMDYRDTPRTTYDKITCLEMSEHVGIRLYSTFLSQVYDMLEDDGIFYLQIAGIRRAWQWEDLLWAFFMDTYIFPGADASLPLTFPVAQLEAAGFEVQSIKTIGVHYSETIRRWYQNWIKDEARATVVKKYGGRLYRIWEIFLAWSAIIARQGNSTCYQIVAHKNRSSYDRKKFIKGY